jgi:hypothetical protein
LWKQALVAGALTAVSTGYMAYLLKTEDVFAKRAAVQTLSPPFRMVLLGFGFVLALAVLGALWGKVRQAFGHARIDEDGDSYCGDSKLFLVVWAVANVAVSYLPVAFQRKMLMGAHLPLAILAGVAISALLARVSGSARTLAAIGCFAVLSITNVRFLLRDMADLPANPGPVRAYIYPGEAAALDWIRRNAPAGAAVQPLPWVSIDPSRGSFGFFDNTIACFTPGLTGHPVNAGHWGETPDFARAMNQWATFVKPDTPDEWRRNLLRQTGVRYVLFTQKHDETGQEAVETQLLSAFRSTPPSYLRRIEEASNADADVYEVAF